MSDLTHSELLDVLHYNPAIGLFWWKDAAERLGGYCAEAIAGSMTEYGYVRIHLRGKFYRAHRLAWFYMTGEWPSEQVDHADGLRAHNAWDNLREASEQQNSFNRKARNHASLPKGVRKQGRGYASRIKHNGQSQYLGTFDTISDASNAYITAATTIAGEFARP